MRIPMLLAVSALGKVLADDYIVSFRNLETPTSYYNKVKDILVEQYGGKIKTEFTFLKGFTVSIPKSDVLTLETALNLDGSFPIDVEKDGVVTMLN